MSYHKKKSFSSGFFCQYGLHLMFLAGFFCQGGSLQGLCHWKLHHHLFITTIKTLLLSHLLLCIPPLLLSHIWPWLGCATNSRITFWVINFLHSLSLLHILPHTVGPCAAHPKCLCLLTRAKIKNRLEIWYCSFFVYTILNFPHFCSAESGPLKVREIQNSVSKKCTILEF